MKKFLVGILTMVYMVVSCGIAMEIHYCMGKRAGMDFYGTEEKKCGKCGMKEKKGGCCNDKHQFVKLEDSHKNVYNDISFTASEIAVAAVYPVYNWQLPADITVAFVNNHSPPDYTGPSVCVMNCVFRI
jgi:hypothetical protein